MLRLHFINYNHLLKVVGKLPTQGRILSVRGILDIFETLIIFWPDLIDYYYQVGPECIMIFWLDLLDYY